MNKIIAVSGVSGAGKTTLSRALAQFYHATWIGWDDFDIISKYPSDYVSWHNNNRDYSLWDYPELSETLHNLKDNKVVKHAVTKKYLSPSPLIIFDSPLGYLHEQTGEWIDFCCHIHLPLDITLCRRLIRDYEHTKGSADEIMDELRFYLKEGRCLFDDSLLIETADLVLDGTLPTLIQVIEIEKNFRLK